MKTWEKEINFFQESYTGSWINDSFVVPYHGGVAIVSKVSFDFSDEKPELLSGKIGYDAPSGRYFVRRGCSNPRNLECFRVVIYRDGSEDTIKARRRAEDAIRKHGGILGRVLAAIE